MTKENYDWDRIFLETKLRVLLEEFLSECPHKIFCLELEIQSKLIELDGMKIRLKKIREEVIPEINEKLKSIGEIKND